MFCALILYTPAARTGRSRLRSLAVRYIIENPQTGVDPGTRMPSPCLVSLLYPHSSPYRAPTMHPVPPLCCVEIHALRIITITRNLVTIIILTLLEVTTWPAGMGLGSGAKNMPTFRDGNNQGYIWLQML
ncbi:hypothetical protein M951_chr1157 (nucleomorph) [Lotharella oceanica]|uniref:Uncharacterized protein n=1 Tax=Lotharella oceanica TaxID=641309 RepID=A0A060D6N0_9EUKA|nr:hypothetical protein M951_chr1157 [Lotharella oceanica]